MSNSGDEILKLLQDYGRKVNRRLKTILPDQYSLETLSQVIGQVEYDLDTKAINLAVNQPVWDLLNRGGKRWRPVLFLMIVDLLGKNPDDFIDLSCVFEMIHNGTLMVDDIEDSSKERRGKTTVHLIYGEDIAINAGNTIYYLPLKVALDRYKNKFSREVVLKIYQTYIEEMVKLSFGQAADIAWHRGLVNGMKISERQYLQMCAFKTGGLARMACKIAAIVGGGSPRLVKVFGKLGESLGVVFQIQDDILNITQSDLSNLKGLGDDITEGKMSLPVIYALKNLPKAKGKKLIAILLMHTRDRKLIKEAIDLINQGRGIKKAQIIMSKLFKKAWESLDPLIPGGNKKQRLYNLARFLIDRNI